MHLRFVAVAASLVISAAIPDANAQDTQPTVIRAARMLDLASGRMLDRAVVVVTGDRITAVNPATPPANARVVDLGDVTLLPGFIDLHTHLISEISAGSFFAAVTDDRGGCGVLERGQRGQDDPRRVHHGPRFRR